MQDVVWFSSSASNKVSEATRLLVGDKAYWLTRLPKAWVPRFAVVTTKGFSKMEKSGEVDVRIISSALTESARLLEPHSNKLIVRSSRVGENLLQRGQLDSFKSSASPTAIARLASKLSKYVDQLEIPQMAFVVQQQMSVVLKGHLSNERRISKTKYDWYCEYEVKNAPKSYSFNVKGGTLSSETSNALSCVNDTMLKERLREVSIFSVKSDKRCHYEWLWDGKNLWIVQLDIEPPYAGQRQDDVSNSYCRTTKVDGLTVFRPVGSSSVPWKKTKSIKLFSDCMLPTPNVYILDNEKAIEELCKGVVSLDIENDLTRLIEQPVIIRTDINAKVNNDGLLLPLSKPISTEEEAKAFLLSVSAGLRANKVKPVEFAFIVHRFIPARAGAWCIAKPNQDKVIIEATWGSPDSLNYHPHDSYQVDVKQKKVVAQEIRCKYSYIYVDEFDKWSERVTAPPLDWKSAMTKKQLLFVADAAHRVAVKTGQPANVMFFVGVPSDTGYPECLPWLVLPDVPSAVARVDIGLFSKTRRVVQNREDLNRIKAAYKIGEQKQTIVLRFYLKMLCVCADNAGHEYATQKKRVTDSLGSARCLVGAFCRSRACRV